MYYIKHDGKELKSFKELQDWYENKIKDEQSANPDFNIRPFAETERTNVTDRINQINPTDNESRTFKKTLFEYLLKVIYKSLHTPLYPVRLPQDIYVGQLSWFDTQFEKITDEKQQKKFIEDEIERTKRNNTDWECNLDISDSVVQYAYEASEMFLNHLTLKLTNYQHTELKSGHETLAEKYHWKSYGLIDTNETLLAELLENRLIIEGVSYKQALTDQWMELQFDQEYFKKFIPGTLYRQFVERIYSKIKPLNNHEINRYLTSSLIQFKTFHPKHREKEFIQKYAAAYWHPHIVQDIHESEERPAKFLLKDFTFFYQMFIDATEKALTDFRAGLLGTDNVQPQPSYEMQINDFFEAIKEGNVTKLERYNLVQKFTDNFELNKLKLLLEDFEEYLFMAKEQREAECSRDEIHEEITRLMAAKKEIPYLKIFEPVKTDTGFKKVEVQNHKVIDKEKLLFPYEFFSCYQFGGFLNDEIHLREAIAKKNTTSEKETGIKKFDDLPKAKATFILKMLEDLSVTSNGKSILSDRKKSALRGVVEALRDKNILPQKSIDTLNTMLADKIGLVLKSSLENTTTCQDIKKSALTYITKNFHQ